tara:strand:- start:141 stop:869 length:729 start_codon:yes stop_codon:yes gene_type:complete
MAYAPPNTFSASTVLTAAALDGNQDALRVYLHEGINSADFQTAKWIETRHLQPPTFEPFTGTQHGISGHQAGQSVEATGIRLSFCTSYLTGNGLVGAEPLRWVRVPNTAISVQTRRAYRGLFHWTMELEHGPDNVPYTSGHNYVINERLNYIAPYVGNPSLVDKTAAQPGQNHQGTSGTYWDVSPAAGAVLPYTGAAGYGQRDGCVKLSGPVGTLTAGLCHYSQIDRVAVVNWSIALELYYV